MQREIPFIRTGAHYSRAPIVEAIIEIRCDLPAEVNLNSLKGAVDPDEYPGVGNQVEVTGTLDISDAGVRNETATQQTGFAFTRSDSQRIVHAGLKRFAYSALRPYDRWSTFSREAWDAWLVYQRAVKPSRATRLGVRYVNRIEIPDPMVEIRDYLRTAIDVSPYLSQMVEGYFLQVQVPLQSYRAAATVTSTLVEPDRVDTTVLVLDIDAWQRTDIDFSTEDSPAVIQQGLDNLRNAKNYVFEACITDATRGLIR